LLPTPVKPAIDEMLTTRPSPLALSSGTKARMVAKTPRKLAASSSSMSSSVSASRSPAGIGCVWPALLTRMSQRP
jgi:hypothetical protein